MKIQCPKCNAGYNIDITKIPAIPEGGVTVNCPKCKGKIPVSLTDHSKPQKKEKDSEPSNIIPCPKCDHVNIGSKTCVSCGKVFTKEEIQKYSQFIGG